MVVGHNDVGRKDSSFLLCRQGRGEPVTLCNGSKRSLPVLPVRADSQGSGGLAPMVVPLARSHRQLTRLKACTIDTSRWMLKRTERRVTISAERNHAAVATPAQHRGAHRCDEGESASWAGKEMAGAPDGRNGSRGIALRGMNPGLLQDVGSFHNGYRRPDITGRTGDIHVPQEST
jgi:hypothetical protein